MNKVPTTVSTAPAPQKVTPASPPKAAPVSPPVFKVPTIASPVKKPIIIAKADAPPNTKTKTYGLVLPSGVQQAASKRAALESTKEEQDTGVNKKRKYGAPSRVVSDQELALQSEDVEAAPDTVAGSKSQVTDLNAAYGY